MAGCTDVSEQDGALQELTDEEAARIGAQRLRDLLVNGGKQIKNYRCTKCGQPNEVEIEVMDPDAMLRTQKWLDERNAATPGDVEAAGRKLLRDLGEMSSEELASLYAQLEGNA